MVRRARILALLLLPLLAALPVQAEEGESLVQLQTRWRHYGESLRDLSREERVAKAKAFFDTVPWEQLRGYCARGDRGVDENNILGTLVNAKLRSGGSQPEIMSAILADPSCNSACQEALVKFFSQYRDSVVQTPESRMYGQAMLDLADSGARSEPINWKLEEGAAFLSDEPRILERAMRYGRSGDSKRAEHGVLILGESRDARAPDSLLVLARELMHAPAQGDALARAAVALAPHCDDRIWSFLEQFYHKEREAAGGKLAREALIALAYTEDPRSYPIFLAEYKDSGTGIRDNTSAIKDKDRRSYYYNLWFFTRLAEPGIIAQLESDGPGAVQAVELLDRASRFGLPASREDLLEPLEAWGQRRGEPWQSRVAQIAERFRSYPEPTGEPPRR